MAMAPSDDVESLVAEPDAPSPARSALLHRPRPPRRALDRARLLAVLDGGVTCSVTILVAPAGSGKSVLVSQWSERLDRHVAWVSLDGDVHDLQGFVSHLAAAVRLALPDALPMTAKAADAGVLAGEQRLTTLLSNEFSLVDQPLLVVLDDYHEIGDPAVHRLLAALLTHPPSTAVHVAVLARRDPPLGIASLRASGQVSELRMEDLLFSPVECTRMVRAELGREPTESESTTIFAATEGWPAGLRLTVQAMRRGSTATAGYLDRGAQEYLLAEVLDRLPADQLHALLVTSVFERFSADLCDAAFVAGSGSSPLLSGQEFVAWLQQEGLFVVPLDDDDGWYRFHHVFRRLLRDWRRQHAGTIDLPERDLHRLAARHFQARGWVEEAARELELAGDEQALARLVGSHGTVLIDAGRWGELSRLLAMVSTALVEREPSLLLLRAWLVGEHDGRYAEMLNLLDRAERLLGRGGPDAPADRYVRGQIAVLRGTYARLNVGEAEAALDAARTAQRLLADSPGHHLTYAYLLEIIALANCGRYRDAHRLADSLIGDERFGEAVTDPMLWARPYLAWVEGNLDLLERSGRQMLAVGRRHDHGNTTAYGHYFLGICAYERDDLGSAQRHLSVAVDLTATIVEVQLHAMIALAFTELAQGRAEDALRTGETMIQEVLGTRGDYNLPTAEAAMALLELRAGRRESALTWARTAPADVPSHRYMFFDRTPALVEILLSGVDSVAAGRDVLETALASTHGRSNRPVSVRLLGLVALDTAARGDTERAVATLGTAVEQACEGGAVRGLADLGVDLAPLLHRLDVSGRQLAHVGAVLRAIGEGTAEAEPEVVVPAAPHVAGAPSLTQRECAILAMLAGRYSNKEIGRELFIAPATVKKHTVAIYQKLNVHGRREAVAKAEALGYLRDGDAAGPA